MEYAFLLNLVHHMCNSFSTRALNELIMDCLWSFISPLVWCMVKLSLHSNVQPPPSPWLNQRPRLDVNVGEYNCRTMY